MKEVLVQLQQVLRAEFGEKLVVVIDQASYLTVRKAKRYVDDTKGELVYFPPGMSRLNPTEECWRQLRFALGNRYFGTLDELGSGIRSGPETINPPEICQYLCR